MSSVSGPSFPESSLSSVSSSTFIPRQFSGAGCATVIILAMDNLLSLFRGEQAALIRHGEVRSSSTQRVRSSSLLHREAGRLRV